MSKMFEILQQTQRDQELLKQYAAPAAIHRRNMDVMHRAGKDQQLFDIPPVPDAFQTEPAPLLAGFLRGETYKLVRHLFMPANTVPPRAVVFCGVDKEAGRDWNCAQAAELLAHLKQASVCVVDANVTNPSLHSYFGVSNKRGLSAALIETAPVMDFTHAIGRGRLRLINAGEPSLGLNSGPEQAPVRLAARVRELRANFDCVLVNAPPVTRDPITAHLSSLVDGVVLIIEPSFTPREATREVKEEIEAAGGRVLGVILHRRPLSLSDRMNLQSQKSASGQAR
jgi:hypothetical protein